MRANCRVRAGCYAEYIAVPERALFALPPAADLEAAACLSNYQVAWHLLHTATRGAPGRTVLVGSASGGLGSAAVQLAKLAGMTAIALVGSDEKARALKAYGADHVIDQSREDVAARVSEITGSAGVDLILDAVGGPDFAKFLPMLGPFGLLVSYGKLVGKIEGNVVDALDAGPGYLNSAAVRIFTMHTLDDKPDIRAESMNYLIGKLAAGAIRPLIHARLPLQGRAPRPRDDRGAAGDREDSVKAIRTSRRQKSQCSRRQKDRMPISEKLKALIRSAWDDGAPCLVATQGSNGPNISPKGSMVVFDDGHLAYWERSKKQALENLGHDKRVCVMYANFKAQRDGVLELGLLAILRNGRAARGRVRP